MKIMSKKSLIGLALLGASTVTFAGPGTATPFTVQPGDTCYIVGNAIQAKCGSVWYIGGDPNQQSDVWCKWNGQWENVAGIPAPGTVGYYSCNI